MEPVEDIVDLLALHLGIDPVGEESVAGLENEHKVTHETHAGPPRDNPTLYSPVAGLKLHLTSVLTCMTPSSVRVLVSITEIPSAVRSAKIF